MSIISALRDVNRFHKAANIQECQSSANLNDMNLRMRLIREEYAELEKAIANEDIVKIADAYADLVYVVLGSALIHFGSDRFAKIWKEVQKTNMAKTIKGKLIVDQQGKVLKPDGWAPPNISAIVFSESIVRKLKRKLKALI